MASVPPSKNKYIFNPSIKQQTVGLQVVQENFGRYYLVINRKYISKILQVFFNLSQNLSPDGGVRGATETPLPLNPFLGSPYVDSEPMQTSL